MAILSIITAQVLARLLEYGWVELGFRDIYVVPQQLLLPTMLGYLIATIAGLACYKHPTTQGLATEVVDELSKVTWPTRDETNHATVVVIVAVIISSGFLGVFDALWLWLTDWLLGAGPS